MSAPKKTPAAKKPAAKTGKAPRSTAFGRDVVAALGSLGSPAALAAVVKGAPVPPGATYTVSRPAVVTGPEVAKLRGELGVSQSGLAAYLMVGVQTVQAWEQGRNPVTGAALRLLAEIRGDLAYWKPRVAAAG